jgi:hypothetical protein
MKHAGLLRAVPASIALFLLFACQQSLRNGPAISDRYWDDLARFLAGMPVSSESPFARLEARAEYRKHAVAMDEFWGRVEKETLEALRPWCRTHVPPVKGDIAFYPLSGADFVNLYSIYPDTRYYLMVALEETGKVPEPLRQPEDRVDALLASIRRTVYDYGVFNYFKSRVMSAEFCNAQKTGNTPALLVFMARMGLTVAAAGPLGIDRNGAIFLLDEQGKVHGEAPAQRGMQYVFYAPGDPRPRVLIYLNMRLDSRALDPETPAGKFFSRLGSVKTVMKSAVYLLHMPGFRAVKEFVLDRSVMIVQDDSGVPFADLKAGDWQVSLFGQYWPFYPITGCTVRNQADLAAEFRKGAPPLPFNFGYGSLLGRDRSNIIMAVRKGKGR